MDIIEMGGGDSNFETPREIKKAPLRIALTFDTDNDYFDSSLVNENQDARSWMRWRGIEEGIPAMREFLSSQRDSLDKQPVMTWFVRVDDQLESIYGSPTYLLEHYGNMWRSYSEVGDEIAWHPHLYRRNQNRWELEIDQEPLHRQMEKAYQSMWDLGYKPLSSRIGEAYGSLDLMMKLEALGLFCDSTAMPGRKRKDASRTIDWGPTPQTPYYPSKSDYRVSGEDHFNLLELPMSMVTTQTGYDKKPLKRYVDLSFRNDVIGMGIREYVNDASLFITVTHPAGVLNEIYDGEHGLVGFSMDNFRANVETIIEACESAGRTFEFVTINQYQNLYKSSKAKENSYARE